MREQQIVMGTGKVLGLDQICSLEEAAVFGTRIIKAFYTGLNAGTKGLLWKVQKGNNTVYMLGSIHIADYGVYPFNHNIVDAYKDSDILGVELNLHNTEGNKYFTDIACYSDGSN
ncbi:TraB/GumN family protein [Cellulosilyticum ruminicola]|uniref:TraB/GumN family protein n=1 Tax=Cellulosilyticum ruminicola TaxID=425254 RepID=UPI0006D0F47E|nr:TraB/GumN family protein [Cellulosilyticum ruminicola]